MTPLHAFIVPAAIVIVAVWILAAVIIRNATGRRPR